jgi:hypothetical protein
LDTDTDSDETADCLDGLLALDLAGSASSCSPRREHTLEMQPALARAARVSVELTERLVRIDPRVRNLDAAVFFADDRLFDQHS